jgi:hypothetical protein
VTGDAHTGREAAQSFLARSSRLPAYRRVLDREGAAQAADVAIVGDERVVEAALRPCATSASRISTPSSSRTRRTPEPASGQRPYYPRSRDLLDRSIVVVADVTAQGDAREGADRFVGVVGGEIAQRFHGLGPARECEPGDRRARSLEVVALDDPTQLGDGRRAEGGQSPTRKDPDRRLGVGKSIRDRTHRVAAFELDEPLQRGGANFGRRVLGQ